MRRDNGVMRIGWVFLCMLSAEAQPRYDLVLKGGHLVDAKNNISAVRDLGISQGKIAAVAANIPSGRGAKKSIDISRHCTSRPVEWTFLTRMSCKGSMGREYLSLERDVRLAPDGFTFRSGVTTVVDAGSSGWRNFGSFAIRLSIARRRVFSPCSILWAAAWAGGRTWNRI